MPTRLLLPRAWLGALVGVALASATPVPSAEPPAGSKRPLTVEDLYRLDAPRSPALAPDGRRAAYVRQWIDAKTRQERNSLWLAEGSREQARPLEAGEPDARAPVFSLDGQWIAFLLTRPRPAGWKPTPPAPPESDPATDVWLIPSGGGQAVPLAGPDKPYGRVFHDSFYGRLAFSPDGRRLALVADDGKDPRTPEEVAADVIVVRPDQGEDYTGYGPAQVWVAHLDEQPGKFAARRIDRLTDDDVWYGDSQWSPDGRLLVVHANKTNDRESVRFSINKNYDLWSVDVATREQRRLTSGRGPEVSPRFAPDSKRLVCLTVPRKGSHRDVFNLAVVTLGAGGPRTEVLFDHHGPGADNPPHAPPAFPLPEDCWDGNDRLVYNAEPGTRNETWRVETRTGKGAALPIRDPKLAGSLAKPDGPDSPAGRLARRRELLPAGNAFLRERLLGQGHVVIWDNDEGMRIEGLLTVPPANVAKPPHKLLLYPHGGPHSRSAQGFDFTVQVFAAHGFAVFQPNFRGSAGYGQRFVDADRADFGGGDMRDILTGIDHLVKEGLVDRQRQFVYGGFLTCWLVGHTNQFRAAVT